MPNHPSAIKRNRQNIKRRARNRMTRSVVRTAIKSVRTKVAEGDISGARTSLRSAESALSRAAAKGMMHRRNAARKIGRLASLVAKAGKK
jgi:small subunit ribosomal protein S20